MYSQHSPTNFIGVSIIITSKRQMSEFGPFIGLVFGADAFPFAIHVDGHSVRYSFAGLSECVMNLWFLEVIYRYGRALSAQIDNGHVRDCLRMRCNPFIMWASMRNEQSAQWQSKWQTKNRIKDSGTLRMWKLSSATVQLSTEMPFFWTPMGWDTCSSSSGVGGGWPVSKLPHV